LSAAPRPPVALYLHVPFCVSHCPYCDFVVVAGRAARGPANRLAAFAAALETELHLRADALDMTWGPPSPQPGPGSRPALASVYLGGGTPSLLPGAAIERLLDIVRDRYGLHDDAEVTIEVNPGPDERGDVAAFQAAGVTRVSIGAQSFDPAELRRLGRRHAPLDTTATVRAARAAGCRSTSLDLLYDIPGQTRSSWSASLDAALSLEPDHLSLYALTLDDPEAEGLTGPGGDHLPTAPGARRWRESARAGQDDDRAADAYETADRRLEAAGYGWYEISNWARPGHESRHNLAYWEDGTWEAVGPGAHAFDGVTRRWNAARLDGYLAALAPAAGASPSLPPGGAEAPDERARDAERLVTALRTRRGLPASLRTDTATPSTAAALDWGVGHGLLEPSAGADRLVLTRRGRLLSNEVFARLL